MTVRSRETFRIEALSDSVFGISVSLLIMSMEVPETFGELKEVVRRLLPFVATVSLVFFFWWEQNKYFRKYGFNDRKVILLNLCLLVLILSYVFPLKFLFMILFSALLHINFFEQAISSGKTVILQEEFPQLILFFSVGYLLIWFIFFELYRHTLKNRSMICLSATELVVLNSHRRDALVQLLIGLASAISAIIGWPIVCGFIFLTIPVWLVTNSAITKGELKRVVQE